MCDGIPTRQQSENIQAQGFLHWFSTVSPIFIEHSTKAALAKKESLTLSYQKRLVGMSQRVFDHREKFRGFEASGPNLRSPFALVSKAFRSLEWKDERHAARTWTFFSVSPNLEVAQGLPRYPASHENILQWPCSRWSTTWVPNPVRMYIWIHLRLVVWFLENSLSPWPKPPGSSARYLREVFVAEVFRGFQRISEIFRGLQRLSEVLKPGAKNLREVLL